ncbi:hypothetical protein D3C85_1008750 [compost metagenome]
MDIGDAGKQPVDGFANIGVEVHRINDINFRVLLGDFNQRITDSLKPVTEAFSTMSGYENQFPGRVEKCTRCGGFLIEFLVLIKSRHYVQQCINYGVPCNDDAFGFDAFA